MSNQLVVQVGVRHRTNNTIQEKHPCYGNGNRGNQHHCVWWASRVGGRDDHQHNEGVTVILRKGMEKCLIEWKPINTMLMKIRMKGKHINITIIQCYSLNNDSETKSRGFIKVLCRRSVGFFSQAFLVFLMKESKKRRQTENSWANWWLSLLHSRSICLVPSP